MLDPSHPDRVASRTPPSLTRRALCVVVKFRLSSWPSGWRGRWRRSLAKSCFGGPRPRHRLTQDGLQPDPRILLVSFLNRLGMQIVLMFFSRPHGSLSLFRENNCVSPHLLHVTAVRV